MELLVRVLSLFSGMGGFDLALEMAGMEIVGQAENDKNCLRVLAHHWPDVRRWTDVRSVSRESFGECNRRSRSSRTSSRRKPQLPVRPDLICGGFPCQDVSVAGKRAGLDGARSGLWFEFHRIVRELRPTYVLVENVPGLLSSNQGRDFAIILDGLADLGFGVSWRVLDSRYFGVAQRRRRVFIVAGPSVERTEAILALCEGCGGHPAAGRAAGEDVAGTLGGGAGERGWAPDTDRMTFVPETAYAVAARNEKGISQLEGQNTLLAVRTAQTSANGHGVAEDVAHTLDGANGQAIAFAMQERADAERDDVGPQGKGWQEEQAFTLEGRPKVQSVAHTLRADGFDASEDGTGCGTPLVAFAENQRGEVREMDISAQLTAGGGKPGQGYPAAHDGVSVRRLTPTECLRLQAMPDDWLDLDPLLSDGAKYRMCGNAVTVSVVQWIGERIMAVERE